MIENVIMTGIKAKAGLQIMDKMSPKKIKKRKYK